MTIGERILYFQELISCNFPVYLWCYDANLNLQSTNCPEEYLASEIITMANFSNPLIDHIKQGRHTPLLLNTNLGLIWIAAFEYDGSQLKQIYVLGPTFNGSDTQIILHKKLDSYNLSVKMRAQIFRSLDRIPIIPSNTMFQYAVMMHFAVTGEHIETDAIVYTNHSETDSLEDIHMITEEHRGIWPREQRLLKLISEGNPEYKTALLDSSSLSNGVRMDIGDSIRQKKNSTLILLTLCTRACITGGLNPSISYSLNDYYAKKIEECKTAADLTKLNRRMLDDFVTRVRKARLSSSQLSSPIQNSCEYIDMHLTQKFSIKELAERIGYTEYYFSSKFKKEVGISVNQYILNKKLEQAAYLLSSTTQSIQDISDDLAFSNRSHFYSCFQKKYNLSPSDYRKNNYQI